MVEREHYVEGSAILREAMRLYPDNDWVRNVYPNAYTYLESALFSQGRYAEAATICQETVRVTPFPPAVYVTCDSYDGNDASR